MKSFETTKKNIRNFYKNISISSISLILAGFFIFFLLALGSYTENRIGSHLVLDFDLISSPSWFLIFIDSISLLLILAGIIIFFINFFKIKIIEEKHERVLILGSILFIGFSAFILALSSISFSAFNWQFFESQIESDISAMSVSMMSLVIIGYFLIFTLIATGINFFDLNKKLYITLRNSFVALIALGWFVFNLCINSYGAMGGDSDVLVKGLMGTSLTEIGDIISDSELANSFEELGELFLNFSSMEAEEFYNEVLLGSGADLPIWFVAKDSFTNFWETGEAPAIGLVIPEFLYKLVVSANGLQNLFEKGGHLFIKITDTLPNFLRSFAKDGPIFGVNNSFNSHLVFVLLIITGIILIPLYGYFTYTKFDQNNQQIIYYSSLTIIALMFILYLFLILTPYMVGYDSNEHYISMVEALLTGKYDPSIAPGLIALPGEEGGIHSAIVYYSPEYKGTVVWWIAEILTFIFLIVPFIVFYFVLKPKSKKLITMNNDQIMKSEEQINEIDNLENNQEV